jgi:hypothetical protein
MESFLEEMLLCYPVLGVDIFEKPALMSRKERVYILRSKGIVARGYEIVNGFVVLAGSQAVTREVPSIHEHLSSLRNFLVEDKAFRLEKNRWVSTQDLVFNSPSTAAGVLLGRSANGRIEWKDGRGKTLKAYQSNIRP